MIVLCFNLVGPILLLSAEKRIERSNVNGLTMFAVGVSNRSMGKDTVLQFNVMSPNRVWLA